MKRFLLKDLSEPNNPFVYRELLLISIRQPINPNVGMPIEEVRHSLRLLDAIEPKKTGEIVELEDTDYEHLLQRIEAFKWTRADHRIIQFDMDIRLCNESA